MEKNLDLNCCILKYSSQDKSINYEKKLIIKSYKLNKRFAKIQIPKFEIKIVNSKKDFEKLWGSKTPNYVSAFAKNNNIVIYSYDSFEKYTKWKKEKFKEALIHEINHLFYQELRDNEYDPLWLSEGLATFMQHQKKKYPYKEKIKITKKILNQSFEEMNLESYQVFTTFVEYLILNFGKKRILKLINELKNKSNLEDSFKKIYNLSLDNLIKNANKYHKIT